MSVDVTIDDQRRVTRVFAGPLPAGHEAACAFSAETAVRTVDGPFDVVLSTNGGHPLDRSLYQSVKGMAAAERIVRDRGIIVMAAACADGVPEGGAFARLVSTAHDPEDLVHAGSGPKMDRWQAQVLGRVLARAEVALFSGGLTTQEVTDAQLRPVHDLDEALGQALASAGPQLCVLPEGPLTVAGLAR